MDMDLRSQGFPLSPIYRVSIQMEDSKEPRFPKRGMGPKTGPRLSSHSVVRVESCPYSQKRRRRFLLGTRDEGERHHLYKTRRGDP